MGSQEQATDKRSLEWNVETLTAVLTATWPVVAAGLPAFLYLTELFYREALFAAYGVPPALLSSTAIEMVASGYRRLLSGLPVMVATALGVLLVVLVSMLLATISVYVATRMTSWSSTPDRLKRDLRNNTVASAVLVTTAFAFAGSELCGQTVAQSELARLSRSPHARFVYETSTGRQTGHPLAADPARLFVLTDDGIVPVKVDDLRAIRPHANAPVRR